MMHVSLMLAAELVFLAIAMSSATAGRLQIFTAINMCAVGLYGPRLMEVAGFQNNAASIFYSFALLAVAIIYRRFGLSDTLQSVWSVAYALLLALCISLVLGLFPHINIPFAEALAVVTERSPWVIAASFGSFALALVALVTVLEHTRGVVGAVFAIMVAQIVDSAFFYPTAFYGHHDTLELILTGIVFKLTWSAIAGPFILLVCLKSPFQHAG